MSKFDISHFKEALTAARARERAHSKTSGEHPKSSPAGKQRAALEQLVKPALLKTGLDLAKLDELIAKNQAETRKLFQAEKATAAKIAHSQRKAFHHAVEEGQAALKYLANPAAAGGFGGLSRLVSLTTPFLIWEWPIDQALIDSHIEPLKSSARIRLDVPAYSFDQDSGSQRREFSFYFYWSNQTPDVAIVNCFSVLSLTGACELYANAGIISGDTTSLTVDTALYPVAYWRPLAPGNDIRSLRIMGDPLQTYVALNGLTAEGGSLFGSAGSASKIFNATSCGMSFQSFGGVQIPGSSTALFEVTLGLTATWNGNTLPDEIIADFADEKMQYSVECPLVVLEFLTQPPAMA